MCPREVLMSCVHSCASVRARNRAPIVCLLEHGSNHERERACPVQVHTCTGVRRRAECASVMRHD